MSLLLNVPTLEVSRLQTGKDAHPSETKIMCEPVAFYSQWRQRNVERLLDKLLVNIRHKLDYGITDAPYKHFPIQEPALRFAREHELAPELRVFSWERDSTGKRSFIVTTYKEFWRQYEECIPAHRHYYEIVQEGWPCHLYFDLEYSKTHNPDTDGQLLVDFVIELACSKFKMQPSDYIELDSSNDVKFSRHLIARAPKACFRSNAHAGKFVEEMLLQEPPLECTEPPLKCTETKMAIQSLFLSKGNDQKRVCFVDRAVYTKNRAFRLMLSSKAGKPTTLEPTGRLQPNEDLKKSFMDSLICNTSPEAKLLTCFEALDPHLSQNRIPKAIAGQSQAEQTCQCPYPEIGTYILSCVGQNGPPGRLRNCLWWPETKLLLLNIIGNRFCANIGRQHKSNGVYYVVDLQAGVWFQKCYDPDCRAFRSELMPLPAEIWPGTQVAENSQPTRNSKQASSPHTTKEGSEGVLEFDFWPEEAAAAAEALLVEKRFSASEGY